MSSEGRHVFEELSHEVLGACVERAARAGASLHGSQITNAPWRLP